MKQFMTANIYRVPVEDFPIFKGKTMLREKEWASEPTYYLAYTALDGLAIFSEDMVTKDPVRFLAEKGIFL